MSKVTVLRYQEGRSDKIWAYSLDDVKRYWGRFGQRLSSKHTEPWDADKLIEEKKAKGYKEVHGFAIVDNYLTEITEDTSTDWVVIVSDKKQFEEAALIIRDILIRHHETVSLDCLTKLQQNVSTVEANAAVLFEPSYDAKLVLLALLNQLKSKMTVQDEKFNDVGYYSLKESLKTNRELFEALGIIKVNRLVIDGVDDDEDACL